MGRRCSECGYRSDTVEFFRREQGGVFRRALTICEACEPYQPALLERRLVRGFFISLALWSFGAFLIWRAHYGEALAALMYVSALVCTSPLRVIIHEAGHALAAVLVGARVLEISVGVGPPWRYGRLLGTRLVIRRYPLANGHTQFARPRGLNRVAVLLILVAGAGANATAAAVALWLGAHLGGPEHPILYNAVQPALGGFAIGQLFGLINLFPFSSVFDGQASDGRQALGLASRPPDRPDPATVTERRAMIAAAAARNDAAAAAYLELAQLMPDAPTAHANVMHYLALAHGDAAALGYFRREQQTIEAAVEKAEAACAHLHANIAWAALKSAPEEELALIDAQSAEALAAGAETPCCLGARGGFLTFRGDLEAGHAMLLQAIRRSVLPGDRAEYAFMLAVVARRAGRPAHAKAFEDLRRRCLAAT